MKTSTLASLAAALMITTTTLPAFAAQPDGNQPGARNGHHGPRIERFLEEFDADGNGSVTLAEIETHRNDMFVSVDADNSGSLSQEEFGLIREMRDAKRENARAEMQAENADKDGGRGFGFKKSFDRDNGKGHGRKQRGMDGRQAGRHDDGPTLAKFDTDKNGSVSLAEFTANTPKMFKHLDRNNDGVINADDFGQKRANAK